MSISNDSTNDGFTPAAEAAADQQQVIDDAFSLGESGQKEESAEQVGDEQLKQEAKSKQQDDDDGILSEKLEMELRVAKQMCAFTKMEFEEKSLQAELKQQRLIEENIELKIKIDRMEKEKEQMEKDANSKQVKELLERIVELEKQQKQQKEENEKKVSVGQLTELQNAQNKLSEEIKEMKKQMKKEQQKMLFLNLRQNCWDVKFCNNELEIIGADCLTVVNKQRERVWRTVFAEHPIPSEDHSSGIFYFEVGVEHIDDGIVIGFAAKQKPFLSVLNRVGTYAYQNNDSFFINGSLRYYASGSKFYREDIVGCGVNLATRQIIFTKNGRRLDDTNTLVSSFDVPLFPFVSLCGFGDKIMAHFGPKFLLPAN